MNVNEALFSLMHLVRNNMSQRLKAIDQNLSPMHMKSLKIISNIEECTGQKLANFIGRDKAQINRLIKELVLQKLLIKKDNPKDKRSQLLALTDSAKELIEEFTKVETELAKVMSTDIEPEKIDEFIVVSQKLKANLEKLNT
ncbi:MarR family winged helix-turn-helix transcriptional regulator [Paraglaciecola marina]|uniref:MarR family winged helix-turn-helix transcriptional regulator n=1 Tax=Paraglaciecola marina TaxID=2500157 RepID=UPI0010603E6F|nr:MarR family transcriptional regulator [Paraglaciecola marina]